ncbi:MAG: hypothetical protein OXC38_04365 [Gammaproteobacteria bacterium]|nr:hypothetical protein [Gammaproteobacteria bacterium]
MNKPMQPNPVAMGRVAEGLPTMSAKIRALDAAGYACADIARFLNRRYQHVRNVLVQGPPKSKSGQMDSNASDTPGNVEPKTLQVAPNGRVVIPAEMRSAMLLDATGHVTARVVEGELRILSPRSALLKAQKMVREKTSGITSLADELIAERRAEAQHEADG